MKKTAVGEQFVPPYIAKTLFEEAAEMGYPATALWWPAMFPARPELPVNTLPGLGTPDIRGQLGVGTLFTTEDETKGKTAVTRFESSTKGRYTALLNGPNVQSKSGPQPATLPVTLDVVDSNSARLTLGDSQLELRVGEWSDIVEVKFKAGLFFNVHAVTRVILTSLAGVVRLYTLEPHGDARRDGLVAINQRRRPQATDDHIQVAVVVDVAQGQPVRDVRGVEAPLRADLLEGAVAAVAEENVRRDQRREILQALLRLVRRDLPDARGHLLMQVQVLRVVGVGRGDEQILIAVQIDIEKRHAPTPFARLHARERRVSISNDDLHRIGTEHYRNNHR